MKNMQRGFVISDVITFIVVVKDPTEIASILSKLRYLKDMCLILLRKDYKSKYVIVKEKHSVNATTTFDLQ